MSTEIACTEKDQSNMKYIQDTLYVISGKWRILIMVALVNGNTRYRDIARSIPKITFRMLSKELKEMELNKLVTRTEDENAPMQVEYALTDYCKTLWPILSEMIKWAKHHRTVI